jgi:hypothetical protein
MSRFVLLLPLITSFTPPLPAQSQPIKVVSVVNAASFQPGMPTGGALATVFCSGLDEALHRGGDFRSSCYRSLAL